MNGIANEKKKNGIQRERIENCPKIKCSIIQWRINCNGDWTKIVTHHKYAGIICQEKCIEIHRVRETFEMWKQVQCCHSLKWIERHYFRFEFWASNNQPANDRISLKSHLIYIIFIYFDFVAICSFANSDSKHKIGLMHRSS